MENTTNVQKSQRWGHVFRHEHIALVWLRDIDPHSAKYRRQSLEGQAKAAEGEYYIPKRCRESDYCFCGLRKQQATDSKCSICGSDLMKWINESNCCRENITCSKAVFDFIVKMLWFWISC